MLKKFLAIILVDQITKAILGSRDFSLGPIEVVLVKNFGLPFGINTGAGLSFMLTLVLFAVLLGYYFFYRKKFSPAEASGLALIFAGAASNIADRIILGYVRDYFDLHLGFVFNVADAAIVIGLAMIVLSSRAVQANGGAKVER